MRRVNLNAGWSIRHEPLSSGTEALLSIARKPDGWIPADIPTDVRVPLIANGTILEPLVAENFLDSRWVEDRSWWFKRVFDIDFEPRPRQVVELTLCGLDLNADIFLNGVHLGQHQNAFRPFVHDVAGLLRLADNELVVRLTCGPDRLSQSDIDSVRQGFVIPDFPVESNGTRFEFARPFLRKPQFGFGWDHVPRVPSIGITGDVTLSVFEDVVVRHLHSVVTQIAPEAVLAVQVEIESFPALEDSDVEIELNLSFRGDVVASNLRQVTLRPGVNWVPLELVVRDPHLWWPNGYGEPHLYSLASTVRTSRLVLTTEPIDVGIRTVRLSTERIDDTDSSFALEVNGTRIFAQGANWVPPDVLFSRVEDASFKRLIADAQEANFTMLRVWGGGVYERDFFYAECNRRGILIWHDFMFSCAQYPDHLDWFVREVELEADYQTRRLRNHPSLALWCGNNEDEWIMWEEQDPQVITREGWGLKLSGRTLPDAVRRNCPEIPYWLTSPFGGATPNSYARGDTHWWKEAAMNRDRTRSIRTDSYDPMPAKFVSEFGYVGPPSEASIARYLGSSDFRLEDVAFAHHTNGFERGIVRLGVEANYGDASAMSRSDFLFRAALRQGVMLGHAFDSMRSGPDCWGALMWDFNDSWGEVGWSIVDYYLQRKVSYHFVRRALRPQRLIIRTAGATAEVSGSNHSQETFAADVEYGQVSTNGTVLVLGTASIQIDPGKSPGLLQFDFAAESYSVFVRPVGDQRIESSGLMLEPFSELRRPHPKLVVQGPHRVSETEFEISVTTDQVAHAVHLDLPSNLLVSDDYFDLLPGETRRVFVRGEGVEAIERGEILATCL